MSARPEDPSWARAILAALIVEIVLVALAFAWVAAYAHGLRPGGLAGMAGGALVLAGIVAAPVAYRMGAGFIPVRKAGKLPWAVVREEYQLEYGRDKLEIHRDAIHPGERILVIDDVLATGGTAEATCRLVEALGGKVVGLGFLIELSALGGRTRLGDHLVESLAIY